jgi:hypothetical protein
MDKAKMHIEYDKYDEKTKNKIGKEKSAGMKGVVELRKKPYDNGERKML